MNILSTNKFTIMKIEDLKPGDVLLCRADPNSWIGRAIVKITKGEVSHAAIYIGGKSGEELITHSEAKGIVYMTFEQFMEHESAGFYVMRHMVRGNLQPVLDAAEQYVNEKIPYPYVNLPLLGLLILLNRFSKDTLKSKIFYDFALLVAIKLMKKVRAVARQDKMTMICSQYAAQCYTDAGADYDIKFEKLLLQFGEAKNLGMQISLLDILESSNDIELGVAPNDLEQDAIVERETQIAQNFIQLLEDEDRLLSNEENISEKDLSWISVKIAESLSHLLTGKKPASSRAALQTIQEFSTNRNFFVTPDDLLSNTKNLVNEGFFESVIAD